MEMEVCCNCKKDFFNESEYVCSECREVLCSSCWSNCGGMCDNCYDKYHGDEEL